MSKDEKSTTIEPKEEEIAASAQDAPAEKGKKPEKEKSPSRKRAKKVIGTILFVIIIAICASIAVMFVAGIKPYAVLSGSMEPTYKTGSMIFVKSADKDDIEIGDVITFMADRETVATHRVTDIEVDEEGVTRFMTQGDANKTTDGTRVHENNLIGKPIGSVDNLGYFIQWIKTPPYTYIVIAAVAFLAILLFLL